MRHMETLEGSLCIGSLSEEHCHHEMKHVWMPDVESFRKNLGESLMPLELLEVIHPLPKRFQMGPIAWPKVAVL